MSSGIVVFAQNNSITDYVEQACLLAMSLHATNPDTRISVITNDDVPEHYIKLFDNIIPIPFNDDAANAEWKIENRWKIYHASPYEKTIVLDSDMLVLQDISTWWDFLDNYDLFFTNKVYTYRGEVIVSDFYRKTFTANYLPNLYVGLHYFKKSDFAKEFYTWMEIITQNWELFYGKFAKENYPSRPSMDVTAAIAAKILNCEAEITNQISAFPSFTHMKSQIQGWSNPRNSWQDCIDTYISEDCEITIGNHLQKGIFHYTENNFVTETIINRYRLLLNV
jgi:hypothetical protein